ncbi:MAG: group I intron-associated PD-(D/E)XK endonuclease [Marmoricola sp.]
MASASDEELALVIEGARSWRGVLRSLGLTPTSAGAMRSVRARADRLGLDYTHFTGQRRWSNHQLRSAVAQSDNWHQVAIALGMTSATTSDRSTLQGHALRLGLNASHLEPRAVPSPSASPGQHDLSNLPRAGTLLAAAWFELCGFPVAWPLEPSRYDLIAWRGGHPCRVQVKTTTNRSRSSWTAQLRTNRKESHTYSPDEIEEFFIVAGDFTCYSIPLEVVAGFGSINLAAYEGYRVPGFTGPANSCPPPGTPTPGSS